MKIRFNYSDAGFRIRKSGLHKKWILELIRGEERVPDNISFVFTDDETVRGINSEFLEHNYYTDVIAFDYTTGKSLRGEIYISIQTVRENAAIFGCSVSQEVRRVMAHAVLHLCGYRDHSNEERKRMIEREDYWLKVWIDGAQV